MAVEHDASQRASQSEADDQQSDRRPEGPGCMPGILAATLLMGVVCFIFFAVAAYLIFQKRTDLAARTLRGSVIPQLEQSRLDAAEKQQVIGLLGGLADDFEIGLYENWQAGGIMQRLIETPLMRWGDLQAIAAWAAGNLDERQAAEVNKQVSRFFRAAELGRAVGRDIHDVLDPVSRSPAGQEAIQLRDDLTAEQVHEVARRARLVADRAEVPDRAFDPVSLANIVRRQIEAGRMEGAR